MSFDRTKTDLKKMKVAYMYYNSLRRFMRLSWRNSAIEMFVKFMRYLESLLLDLG